MNGKQLLLLTVQVSIIIQILTGIISWAGLFLNIKKGDRILFDVLAIETIVQLVELIFYIYIALAMGNIKIDNITSRRYFDWAITTPIMLLSTALFMEYDNAKEEDEVITSKEVIIKNKSSLLKIFIYNFLMLVFGYLGETKALPRNPSIFIGFIFFGLSFKEIWENFGYKTVKSRRLFYFLLIIWGFYGIAAMFPLLEKNIMYNGLDIISKNFYGLYIFYEIIKISK